MVIECVVWPQLPIGGLRIARPPQGFSPYEGWGTDLFAISDSTTL